MQLLPACGGGRPLFERVASGVSSGVIKTTERTNEGTVCSFVEGDEHKTEDFPYVIYAYFVLHNYRKVHKEPVNEQSCSPVRQGLPATQQSYECEDRQRNRGESSETCVAQIS